MQPRLLTNQTILKDIETTVNLLKGIGNAKEYLAGRMVDYITILQHSLPDNVEYYVGMLVALKDMYRNLEE
jgi:hypothetical protein